MTLFGMIRLRANMFVPVKSSFLVAQISLVRALKRNIPPGLTFEKTSQASILGWCDMVDSWDNLGKIKDQD